MLPIRTILVPTDFSKRSDYTFRLACSLAKDYHARLVVLHVAPVPVAVYAEGMVIPQSIDNLDELRRKLENRRTPDPIVQVEHRLVEGEPASEILRIAEESKCDLLVMGTHGRTGLGRFLMGSVTEEVLRRAPCPVVTIRNPFRNALTAETPELATAT